MQMNIQQIALKDIVIKENIRAGHGDKEISSLMESIKQHGLKQPIGVKSIGNGKYEFLFGFRRFLAFEKLGYTKIPAILSDKDIDYKDSLIINAIENIQRKDVTPVELGRICEKLDKQGLTDSEIAARLGLKLGVVTKAKTLYNKLPANFRDRVKFFRTGQKKGYGSISSTAAFAALEIGKTNGLTSDELSSFLEIVRKEELPTTTLRKIAGMMKSTGISAKEAVEKMLDYDTISVDFTIKRSDIDEMMKKYNVGKQNAVRMAAYGMLPSFKRPNFIKFAKVSEE